MNFPWVRRIGSTQRSRWVFTRDSVLFVVGILGIIYETVVTQVDRPSLLVLFGGMVGLPAFFRADERRDSRKDSEK